MSKPPKYKTIPIVNIPKDVKRYRREWLRGAGLVVFCDTPRGVAVYATRSVGGKRPAKKMEIAGFIAYDTRSYEFGNPVVNCTHPVPKNRFGIFAMHCKDNQPMSKKDLRAIINGPIAAMQDKLTEELAKPVILTSDDLP